MAVNHVDPSAVAISVLIVDDDEPHAQAVADSLDALNCCDCTIANSGTKGVELIESQNFDVVITDLKMDDVDGLAILRKAKDELPDAEVIVLTAHSSIPSVVTAMQGGAYTYLTKPLDIQELRSAVDKASSRIRLIRRNVALSRGLDEKFGFEGVIGNSPAMHRVIEQLKNLAPTDTTVLILGESGTGKELVARALHQNSPRKNKPFVPLNISALPESILESELWGHEAGAFTGAATRRIGKFEYANGGTLFLDEVGEMPMDTQIKLLRVLEDRKITRLGSNEEKSINVRLVAATNAALKSMMEEGEFRSDLYYRLSVVTIYLPPLRDRREDIPLLIDHFLKDLCKRNGREVEGISRAARQVLVSFDWPGNIRQLRNVIEGMLALDMDGKLDVDDLPTELATLAGHSPDGFTGAAGTDMLIGRPLNEVEKYYIARALELTGGRREETATMLGMGERTLYRKIKEYDLK
ncbi:sigma-54-dependent transcriptional regulator [Planctomicrobium piriforme]|uniref:Two-component system, NtrC family, response regulator HydG n=1 Tax=Planctomicrobium piriforme TaxID=1576369 RepID=A0A1I3SET2_9PLAN|nr:sigma-54 dependent transcriptional regulator [Planctomicrobium piriforme]SFJ57245.1 two-component system, NtrC family, response regulator HydG [Planctomicrobium piriforme]